MKSSTDTVIIGAGPYGLSISAYLSEAGVPNEVIGDPMHAWKNYMPPGMLMRSEAFASNLHGPLGGYTLEEYCRHKSIKYEPVGMRLPLETFVDYALWFQSHLVNHARAADVVSMRREQGVFRVELSNGDSLIARRAVIALGLKGFEQFPPVLRRLPKPYVAHSGEIGNLSWAKNKTIVIVGGGQSALGLGALLCEMGARVRILVRDNALTWTEKPDASRGFISKLVRPQGGLGPGWRSHIFSEWPFIFYMLNPERRRKIIETSWGPSGAWWLHDRVTDKVEISLNSEICHAEIENGQVVMRITTGSEASLISAEHVIVATGFKVDLKRHSFLSPEIKDSLSAEGGAPKLSKDFETSIQGLYVVGPASAPNFGPVMRFIYGAKYTAPLLARHIGSRFREDGKLLLRRSVGHRSGLGEAIDDDALPGQGILQNTQE